MTKKGRLIRSLLVHRVENDALSQQRGIVREHVDAMSIVALMGTPEATIVKIVEIYNSLHQRGLSDDQAFQLIAKSRSCTSPPAGLDLSSFTKKVVREEHANDIPISEPFVDRAINAAMEAVSAPSASHSNRFIALSTAAFSIGLGVIIIYFLREWWAYVVAAFPLMFGVASLKIGIRGSATELSAMTGDRPMTDDAEQSIGKKMR
jgi:hypothetical protein